MTFIEDTRPLDFPKLWGKLGNWPGTMGPQSARLLLTEIAKLPRGSNIIELGFDGGRTSVIIGWGCKFGHHSAIIAGPPSNDGMSEIWFKRLTMLFELREALHRYHYPTPTADVVFDLLVVNPFGMQFLPDWLPALKQEGNIFYAQEGRFEKKSECPELSNDEELQTESSSVDGDRGNGRDEPVISSAPARKRRRRKVKSNAQVGDQGEKSVE